MENSNQEIKLSKSSLLADSSGDNLASSMLSSSADRGSSSSLLSDVYNWGARKLEEQPYVAAGAAALGIIALTKGRAIVEGIGGLAAKQELSAIGTRALPALSLTTLAASALAMSGCSENIDITSKQSDSKLLEKPDEKAAEKPSTPEHKIAELTPVKVYETPQQCAEDGVFTQSYCNEKFEEVAKLHFATAPKFESKETCEKETGKECVGADAAKVPMASSVHKDSGGNWFMPFMLGYMLASPSRSGESSIQSTGQARPLYSLPNAQGGTKEFVTSEGSHVGKVGNAAIPSSSLRVPNVGTVFRNQTNVSAKPADSSHASSKPAEHSTTNPSTKSTVRPSGGGASRSGGRR